jgi:hypothetical protein
MIENDQQLQIAQETVGNLQEILLAARKVHNQGEYQSMSAPILLELQRREQDILDYLSHADIKAS